MKMRTSDTDVTARKVTPLRCCLHHFARENGEQSHCGPLLVIRLDDFHC